MNQVTAAVPERHPAARLGETLARLPSYLRLARALLGDRRLSRMRKAGLGAGLAYLASPIDLVPGIVPVLGQVDDLLVVLMALRFALRGLPGPAADAVLARAGLSSAVVARDIANVRAAGGWAIRSAAHAGTRAATTGARAATTGARAAATATRGLARAAGSGLDAARSGIDRFRGRRQPPGA
jgi:uncharacterized membrane protein YkvA (DUF1232 family)